MNSIHGHIVIYLVSNGAKGGKRHVTEGRLSVLITG